MSRTHPIDRPERGLTLIEIMVSLVLVGLMVVGAVTGLQSITKSDLRGSASRLAGSIRYLFDRASTTGRAHRLVFDFKEGSYWAEVTDDKVFLNSGKETEETRRKLAELIDKEKEEERKEEERSEFQGSAIPARYLPKPYKPKRAEFGAFQETSMRKVTLPGKILLADYYVPRLEAPVTEGQAYLYFFPLGMTEPALIHLSDAKRETFYSLVVHPLTGRVKVVNRYIEPDMRESVDDEGKPVLP